MELFQFRASITWSDDYSIWVARCIETGSVACSEDPAIAEDMLWELLQDEVAEAVRADHLEHLTSSPAPLRYWREFLELEATSPTEKMIFPVKLPGPFPKEETMSILTVKATRDK